jgi:hypothetical protein
MTCIAPDCSADAVCRDYCWTHYRQWKRAGRTKREIQDRLNPRARVIENMHLFTNMVRAENPKAWDKAWAGLVLAWKRYLAKAKPGRPRKT